MPKLTLVSGGLDPLMVKYNESIFFDRVLYKQDILGSIAFARANAKAGIITQDEFQLIERGLREAEGEWAAGTFTIRLTKGTITFEKGSSITKRPLTQKGMEQGGTVFTYRLEKDDKGNPVLRVNDKDKPASEGRRFVKETEGKS